MAPSTDSQPYAGPERRRSALPGQGGSGERASNPERNPTEEALRAITRRLDLALEGSGIGIWELELTDGSLSNARIVHTNVFEQLGYGPPETPPDVAAIIDLIHPEDRDRIVEAYQGILAGETDHRELEYRLRHHDGSYRTMLMRGVAVYDATGKPTRIIGSRIDITDRKRAEAERQASEERFRLLTEALAGFLYDYDLTGGHVKRFGGVEETLGFDPAAIPPVPDWWIQRIHPEDLPRVMHEVKQAYQSDAANYVREYRIRHQQGHYIYVADRGRIIRDQAGRPVRVLGGVSDITDRKRSQEALHQSEERFRIATEALAGFIYDWDPIRDQVQYFGGLVEVLGFRPEEVPQDGAWWTARVHPQDLPKAQRMGDALVQGTTLGWAIEYKIRHRDGHYVEVVDRCRVVHDQTGRVIRVVGGVYGVSERRRLEREREALLERERVAREAAEAAAHERDAVLGIVSHDLGTPLSTIAMCATSLGNQAESAEDRRKAVDLIDRAVAYMHHMIRDLSDVASIEAGHLALDLREEDPAAIVEEVAEMLAGVASDRGIALETRIGAGLPSIRADAARVVQGLANLAANALQFTERGGSVTLRAEDDQTGVRFTVEDTGLGIAADDLPHVFDRYWQKRPRAMRHGTGLGLAITRGIIEAHGGTLRAESTAGVGSRFSFTIPLADERKAIRR